MFLLLCILPPPLCSAKTPERFSQNSLLFLGAEYICDVLLVMPQHLQRRFQQTFTDNAVPIFRNILTLFIPGVPFASTENDIENVRFFTSEFIFLSQYQGLLESACREIYIKTEISKSANSLCCLLYT